MENRLNDLYRQIAETVNEMIPENWVKFHFYAQVTEDGGGAFFFYLPAANPERYEYSVEIPYKYEVDEKAFKTYKRRMFSLAEEMREVFLHNDHEPWYSFTMSLERTGKLRVHFDYTDWFNTDYSYSDQVVIWKHKYLSEMPEDSRLRTLIEKYLEEYPDNPI